MNQKVFLKGILSSLLVFGLMFAGCGGGDEGPDPNQPGNPSTTPHAITISSDISGGTVTASLTRAAARTTITVTATPDSGKKLTEWKWNTTVLPVASTATFTMPTVDVIISATFADLASDEKTITYTAVTGGTVSGPTYGKNGEAITLTATPAAGYKLDSITCTPTQTLSGSGNTRTFTMPASAVTINATFAKVDYTIKKDTVSNGTLKITMDPTSLDGSPEITAAQMGDYVNVEGIPNSGYILGSVTVTGASGTVSGSKSGNFYYFRMPAEAVTVNATFVTPIHVSGTITVNVTTSGGYSYGSLYLYSDAEHRNQVGSASISIGSSSNWSFDLPAAGTYYPQVSVSMSGPSLTKDLPAITVPAGGLVGHDFGTVTISTITLSGTATVTLNGATPSYVSIYAYTTENFSGSFIGYASLSNDGTWSMTIPSVERSTTIYFRVSAQGTSGSGRSQYKAAGSITVSNTDTNRSGIGLGTIAITTKTISGTVKDGITTLRNVYVELYNRAGTSWTDIEDNAVTHGSAGSNASGAWSMEIPSDVNTGYFLIAVETAEDVYDVYISEAVNITGTAIVLDLGTMKFLESFEGH